MSAHSKGGGAGAPDVIYIIRHGEKPADVPPPPPGRKPPAAVAPFGVDFQGNENVHSLLPRGWQRSGGLAALFDPGAGSPQAGLRTPTSLLSPWYGDPTKTAAHRTYQTIQGLCGRLGLQINSPFPEGQESQLAASVVSGHSGVVLICWEHRHIPALALAIPTVPATVIPANWPGERFDVVWSFTVVPGSQPARYSFGQVPQQLLSGDLDNVIATT
jgi:hypothetical protein